MKGDKLKRVHDYLNKHTLDKKILRFEHRLGDHTIYYGYCSCGIPIAKHKDKDTVEKLGMHLTLNSFLVLVYTNLGLFDRLKLLRHLKVKRSDLGKHEDDRWAVFNEKS
jgi:hypothetical protein